MAQSLQIFPLCGDFPGTETGPLAGRPDLAALADDPARLSEFSDRWLQTLPRVRACLIVFLGDVDEVNDCAQEVAMVAWRKAPPDLPQAGFTAYCLACARLIGMAARRKLADQRLVFLAPDVAESLCDAIEFRSLQARGTVTADLAALRLCLADLHSRQKELLDIRYSAAGATGLDGLAQRWKVRTGALYKKLERLRTALRKCMERRRKTPES